MNVCSILTTVHVLNVQRATAASHQTFLNGLLLCLSDGNPENNNTPRLELQTVLVQTSGQRGNRAFTGVGVFCSLCLCVFSCFQTLTIVLLFSQKQKKTEVFFKAK